MFSFKADEKTVPKQETPKEKVPSQAKKKESPPQKQVLKRKSDGDGHSPNKKNKQGLFLRCNTLKLCDIGVYVIRSIHLSDDK